MINIHVSTKLTCYLFVIFGSSSMCAVNDTIVLKTSLSVSTLNCMKCVHLFLCFFGLCHILGSLLTTWPGGLLAFLLVHCSPFFNKLKTRFNKTLFSE